MQFTPEENKIMTEIQFARFIQQLDLREILVVQMLLWGATIVDIARRHGTSRRHMTRIVGQLRKKFDAFFMSHMEHE
jgi:hypothetical protein